MSLTLNGKPLPTSSRRRLLKNLGIRAAIVPHDNTSTELQKAHDAAVEEGQVLDLSGATYDITVPVTFHPARVMIEGNGATLSGTNMLGSHLLKFDAPSAQPMFGTRHRDLSNISIVGPGENAGSNLTGLLISGESSSRSPRPSFRALNINGFTKGLEFINRAYLCQFYSIAVYNCKRGIVQQAGADAGENISFFGGAIYNCGEYCLQTVDDSAQLFFHSVSFDYTPRIALIEKGQVILTDCHIEGRASGGRDWLSDMIDLVGDGTQFLMNGGAFIRADLNAFDVDQIVNTRHAHSIAAFNDVYMHNLQNTANFFHAGPGRCISNRRHTLANGNNSMPTRMSRNPLCNLAIDGDFGTTSGTLFDNWHIASDAGAKPTNRYASTNASLAITTEQAMNGTRSLRVQKTAGAATSVLLYVSCSKNNTVTGRFHYMSPDADMQSAIGFEMGYAKYDGNDENGVPNIRTYNGVMGSGNITPSATWAGSNIRTAHKAPSWADGFFVRLNFPSGVSGRLYLDDINFSEW